MREVHLQLLENPEKHGLRPQLRMLVRQACQRADMYGVRVNEKGLCGWRMLDFGGKNA